MKLLMSALAVQATLITSSHALNITLNPTAGMDVNALAAFQAAADYWESKLSDDVLVNIDVDFSDLGANTLGSAGSFREVFEVAVIRDALIADATTATDALAISNLPTLSGMGGLSFLTQVDSESGSTLVSLDNDDSANNKSLAINTANAKALGWIPSDLAAADATITFNSLFSWDYDQSDGVGDGLQDFVGVAVHEIGHALGFVSGVDVVDFFIGKPTNLDEFAVYSALDLFRYSADRDLNLAAGSASYFSLDGGVTNLGLFSTGTANGDGEQASHWKDNLELGIMDPTARPSGEINIVSSLDLVAFDAIGWNLVPEPCSALLIALGGLFGLVRRRR